MKFCLVNPKKKISKINSDFIVTLPRCEPKNIEPNAIEKDQKCNKISESIEAKAIKTEEH